MPPHPNVKLFTAVVGTQIVAVLMCGFGWLVPALPWRIIGWVWVYNLVWMVALDVVKLALYRIVEGRGAGTVSLTKKFKQPLDSHAGLHQRVRRK
jgi:H+-transporting ATPase